MQAYMQTVGGYVTNPNDISACHFCSIKTTDQFLEGNFNIFYAHHWRNFAFLLAFIAFNVRPLSRASGWQLTKILQISCIYIFTYFFQIRTRSLLSSLKSRLARRKSSN